VGKSFAGVKIIDNFSYILAKDDRIGVVGPNGCGKSTLLKIIAGRLTVDSGSVSMGETVKLGFFTQESEGMDDSIRVIDYIRNEAEYLTTNEGLLSASQMLERFLFLQVPSGRLFPSFQGERNGDCTYCGFLWGHPMLFYLMSLPMTLISIHLLYSKAILTSLKGQLSPFPMTGTSWTGW
jgi:energy-coupling factor transporter ATP-binding protein EcfA2